MTCATLCQQILDMMGERISPNITIKAEVEQSKLKLKVGDLVLLREDSVRNKWPRIVEIGHDSTRVVHSMKLKLHDASLDCRKVLR